MNRPNASFRGYAGLVSAGSVSIGDRVRVEPSGAETRIARIVTYDGDLDRAVAGQSVTLVLSNAVDVSRGSVLASAAFPPRVAASLRARLFWAGERALHLGDELARQARNGLRGGADATFMAGSTPTAPICMRQRTCRRTRSPT